MTPDGSTRWAGVAPVPADGVLLHIGPFKTGTTAIQEALAASRRRLARRGVSYPGTARQHSHAAMAALGTTYGWADKGGVRVPPGDWRELVAELPDRGSRVVLSSEYFCLARPRQIRSICKDLGRDRVHVLITLRSLARLLPSSWQQYVKSGQSFRYEQWLRGVLAEPPDPGLARSFWVRNDHAALVRRWADAVGPDRVTVLVLDDEDRAMLYEVFERLLALPPDTLRRRQRLRGNRSLSAAEAEVLRAVNEQVAQQDVGWPTYLDVVRGGAVRRLLDAREPAPGEARIATPPWALERAARLGRGHAAAIAASGVRVIGELDRLAERLPDPLPGPAAGQLPVGVSAELLLGALSGAMRRGPRFGEVAAVWPALEAGSQDLAAVPTRRLLRGLGARARRRTRGAAGRIYHTVRGGGRPAGRDL